MFQAGTLAYFLSGIWLIWVARDAGILAVVGLLVLPGYPLTLARSNWPKTCIPLLAHIASIVLIVAGIYFWVLPFYRMYQSVLGSG
jgi:hypothetical protein